MLPASTLRTLSDSEMVIHRLYEITSRYDVGLKEQLRQLLHLGRDRFDLEIGIVARIRGSSYRVMQAVAPVGMNLSSGDQFDLANTYCSITLDADGPVGFEHAAKTSFARHPAYHEFKLESYIGIPLYVKDRLFGTLNFSSPAPRHRKFEAVDVDSLRLMGSWIGTELRRRATEQKLAKAHRDLQSLVRTDPLTELRNRRGIAESLELLSQRSHHDGTALSCILVDIDDFKRVNDGYGHSVGDAVIREVAERIRECLRPTDVAARVGGDEFLVVLPEACSYEACRVADRIVGGIRALDLDRVGMPLPITVSVGVSEVPKASASVTDVLRCTEDLLKRSKSAGKDMVTV